jgi:hypothetical protein
VELYRDRNLLKNALKMLKVAENVASRCWLLLTVAEPKNIY